MDPSDLASAFVTWAGIGLRSSIRPVLDNTVSHQSTRAHGASGVSSAALYRSPAPRGRRPAVSVQQRYRFFPNSLQQVFKRLYLAAGIKGASFHSGRRASRLIEKGIDIKAVSTLMGHATVAMIARYAEDNPARLRSIASEVL